MARGKTYSSLDAFGDKFNNEIFQKELRKITPIKDLIVQIINRRDDLGYTQSDLANKANTFQSRISKIESGSHDIRLSTLINIAEALKTEVEISLIPFEKAPVDNNIFKNIDIEEIGKIFSELLAVSDDNDGYSIKPVINTSGKSGLFCEEKVSENNI